MIPISRIRTWLDDHVRMVQAFTLSRQMGIIAASVVIARLLPVEEVGGVELLFFCGYLMTFFWSDAFLKGYLSKKSGQGADMAPSAFLIFCWLTGMLAMMILYAGRKLLIPLFTDRIELHGLALFGLYQALVVPMWLAPYTGGLRKQNMILVSAFVLAGPPFAVWFGHNSLPGVNGILVGLLSYGFVGFVWMLTQIKPRKELPLRKLLVMLWPLSWPLMLYAVSAAVARSLDAWLVARYFDASAFAIFRYGAREFPLVVALAGGLSTIMIPKLVQMEAVPELKKRSASLMHKCYPLIAVLMFFSPLLFAWVFGDAYRQSALIFNIYLLLTLTQLIFPQTVLIAKGNTRLLWYISLLELMINITASLILMSVFGLIGIVWGTLIAFAFEKIVLLALLKRLYQLPANAIMPIKAWSMYALLLSITFMSSIWVFGM